MNKQHTFRVGLMLSIPLALIILLVFVFPLIYAKQKSNSPAAVTVALITDSGEIDDNSYNQFAYSGMKNYCEKKGISYSYYKPADSSIESSLSSVDEAVKYGAELIVCSSPQLNETVYQAQSRYEDVCFILVDGEPSSNDGSVTQIGANVTSLLFDDDEAGFLAGYCAVVNGFTKLAVIYNSNIPSDMHYYYGFLQGADYAAQQDTINLTIRNKDFASAQNDTIAKYAERVYNKGTELIFTCNRETCEIVQEKAKSYHHVIMNAGGDLSALPAVAGSIAKNIQIAVYFTIESYFDGSFNGGKNTSFNTANLGISFIANEKIMTNFSSAQYDNIYNELANGSIPLISDTTVSTEDLNLKNVHLKNNKS